MQAEKSNLYNDVSFLSNIYPYRNFRNLESLRIAARHIESEFDKTGLPTSVQKWIADGNVYENIIASYQPGKEERLIVGAHYDAYYDQPGADDNASGVAGLLELARLLARNNYSLEYGIDFVSYCLEEPPFFKKKEMGSYVHAKSIYEKKQDIIGMISLEMIGYYSGKANSVLSPSEIQNKPELDKFIVVAGIEKFEDFNNKIVLLLKDAKSIGIKRKIFSDSNPNNGPSDHRNYWQFNYPAVMIIGGKENGNPNYHKITDTIDTLDFETMAVAINCISQALLNF